MLTLPLTYMQWNDRLAGHFFRPELAGRQVYLYVTEELVTRLGTESGAGVEEFVSAVRNGPRWVHTQGLCQKAYHCSLHWRVRKLPYPPYVAYLSLFVLAAGLEGDFASHAYYPRLRRIIGEPAGSTLPSFDLMRYLWDDLAKWSSFDKHGDLGIFTVRVSGGHAHVGLPIAQAILSEHERHSLPAIFSSANLDPTSPPSDFHLARCVLHHGLNHLRPHTIRLLRDPDEQPDVHEILIRSIKDELLEWDGSLELTTRSPSAGGINGPGGEKADIGQGDGLGEDSLSQSPTHFPKRRDEGGPAGASPEIQQVHSSLRLCMKLDRVKGSVVIGMRCSTRHEFPEIGLRLSSGPKSAVFCCEEALQGWSSLLCECETGAPVDAAQFNWTTGLEMYDNRLGWRSKLSDSPARIFVSGASKGLPGLIEVNELPRQVAVYIIATDMIAPLVQEWGRYSCRDFKEIKLRAGLPSRWRLFYCAEVLTDQTVRDVCPSLSFSHSVHLSPVGGIRSSRGNNYFYFALPDVDLEGGEGQEKVYCNGCEMGRVPESTLYRLPQSMVSEKELAIEARRGDAIVARLFMYITHEVEWKTIDKASLFDGLGNLIADSTPESIGLAGAYLVGIPVPSFSFAFPPHVLEGPLVYLVGRVPGEISVWPAESAEHEWVPIWAIQFPRKKLGYAVFCGSGADDIRPAKQVASTDRKRIRLWKDVLWYSRKRITPPTLTGLRALWVEYQEAARDLRR